jgi:CubicO group peptidase (beta-lactamase class C family)
MKPEGPEERQMAKEKVEIKWSAKPADHHYLAARSYLDLLFQAAEAEALIRKLRRVPVSQFMAKDIFRASGLSLLGISNSRVERDREKIKWGEELSPLLLVRDPAHGKVVVADGYHRLCAVYGYDEEAWIPCKIV